MKKIVMVLILTQKVVFSPVSFWGAEEDPSFSALISWMRCWVGNGMKPEPEQMMRRLNRLFDGSMEDFIRRYLR